MKIRITALSLIVLYIVIFIFMIGRSLNLQFNGELTALLPSENNHIETYNKLSKLNSSEGGFDAVIRSTDGKNILEKAQYIVDEILDIEEKGRKIFKNAELENDLYSIKNSALYLMTDEELDEIYTDVFQYIEDQKLKVNPVYVGFSEEESVGEDKLNVPTESSVLLNDLANSAKYRINADSSIVKVLFVPDFPKSDFTNVEKTYQVILAKSAELEQKYISVELHWGGSYVRHFHKINDIQYAILKALVIGIICLILFLICYMLFINKGSSYKKRYITVDLVLIFFSLFSGFVISLGISSFVFYEINVFTGIIFSILFGINLDYILHVYAVNKETGVDLKNLRRIWKTYFSASKPILLSCLTTGMAIMSLILTDFKGFKQFGLIFFINILVNLVVTYLFLLLSPSAGQKTSPGYSEKSNLKIPAFYTSISKGKKKTVHLGIIGTLMIAAFFGVQNLTFNFSFSDLEPRSVRSNYDELSEEINTGIRNHDPTFFITDTIEESKQLFNHLKNSLQYTYNDIAKVESFSARYPIKESEIISKESKIDSLKTLFNRNEQYLNAYQGEQGADNLIEVVQNTEPPQITNLPKYIQNRFLFQDGSIAPMVIVYSAMSLSNGATAIEFRKSSGSIEPGNGKTYYAASTSIIASSILELLIKETGFLLVVPMLTICGVLLINYRSVKDSFIAISPLVITFLMLLSLKNIFEFQINLYNVIVLPIIIGVGADNGIHLVDTIKAHKKNFFRYFISKKYPVLVACSITTILGFVGLLFINHPGMESIGILAIAGILATLLATLITSTAVSAFLSEQ